VMTAGSDRAPIAETEAVGSVGSGPESIIHGAGTSLVLKFSWSPFRLVKFLKLFFHCTNFGPTVPH
jgi:hypothetical protein